MVNIIMIAKDRSRLTCQALRSLRDNTEHSAFNLTLVDDGSASVPVGPYPPSSVAVRIVPSKGIVGLVRNIGADFATRYWGRGEWLLFLDNDVYLHPGWLEKMVDAADNDYYYRIIGGCRHPFHQPNNVVPKLIGIDAVDAVAGYSMLMSWETWDDYGPFDQHAKGLGQSEDFAICQKVIKDGYRVGYISPPVLTVTGLTNTLGEKVPGWELLKAMVPAGVMAE